MTSEKWQEDWNSFIDAIEIRISQFESDEEISHPFAGKKVTWTGVLEKIDIDDVAPSVRIGMPKRAVRIGELSDTLTGFSLPISNDSSRDWESIEIGKQVTFQAQFFAPPPFNPIKLRHLKSGKALLFIGLSNGAPLFRRNGQHI